MARSSIERDPEVRAAVDQALSRGATIDEIVERIRDLGSTIGRSSVGRYAQRYSAMAERQRDMQSVASAFATDFGQAGDSQGRMLVQLGTSLLTRFAMATASEDDPEISTKQMMEFGRAVQSLISAAKIDADREARVREEARKQAKLDAVEAAEGAARSAGASDETIRRVRASILGIDA